MMKLKIALLNSDHKDLACLIAEIKDLENHLHDVCKSYERIMDLQKSWAKLYTTCPPLSEQACQQLSNLQSHFISPGWQALGEHVKTHRQCFEQLLEAEKKLDNLQKQLRDKKKAKDKGVEDVQKKESETREDASKEKRLLKSKRSLVELEAKVAHAESEFNEGCVKQRQFRLDNFRYAMEAFADAHIHFAKRVLLGGHAQKTIVNNVPKVAYNDNEQVDDMEMRHRLLQVVADARHLWEQPGGVAARCLCECHRNNLPMLDDGPSLVPARDTSSSRPMSSASQYSTRQLSQGSPVFQRPQTPNYSMSYNPIYDQPMDNNPVPQQQDDQTVIDAITMNSDSLNHHNSLYPTKFRQVMSTDMEHNETCNFHSNNEPSAPPSYADVMATEDPSQPLQHPLKHELRRKYRRYFQRSTSQLWDLSRNDNNDEFETINHGRRSVPVTRSRASTSQSVRRHQ